VSRLGPPAAGTELINLGPTQCPGGTGSGRVLQVSVEAQEQLAVIIGGWPVAGKNCPGPGYQPGSCHPHQAGSWQHVRRARTAPAQNNQIGPSAPRGNLR